MIKLIWIFVLSFLFTGVKAQEMFVTDPIQSKAVVVLPTVTKAQLELLKTEFVKYRQIQKAVFVFKNHNCLLLDIKPGDEILLYSDLMKVISIHVPLKDIILKDPKAYDEIYTKDYEGNDFVLK